MNKKEIRATNVMRSNKVNAKSVQASMDRGKLAEYYRTFIGTHNGMRDILSYYDENQKRWIGYRGAKISPFCAAVW